MNLESNIDAVMVDKGICIDELCEHNAIKVTKPPFLCKIKQFSKSDADRMQKIASARVHVEQIMQRLKIFRIINDVIDWDMLPYLDNIVTVHAGIVNLS